MKVAIVVQRFPVISETFIVNKVTGLLEKGMDVYIVCNRLNQADWNKFPQLDNFNVRQRVRVSSPTQPSWTVPLFLVLNLLHCLIVSPRASVRYLLRGYKRFGFNILKRFYLDSQLLLLKPDIVHFEFGAQAFGRMYLKSLLDCKLTVSFRGYDMNYDGLENLNYYNEIWNTADRLHFLGQDLRKRAIRRGCSPDQPFALIPPAIDDQIFSPSVNTHPPQKSGTALRILSVGRLDWKKGHEFALQAIKRFSEIYSGSIEYHIIGDGDLFESLHFCRHQLGLENQVVFLGAAPHARVIEEMQNTDIFLHAAVSEGFCNAVLEAQAMQLPIVSSDAGGLPENVEDGVTGFVVPRRDPQAMAEKLLQLAENPDLRSAMGQAGRERVSRNFRLEQQIEAFSEFYKAVLSDAPSS